MLNLNNEVLSVGAAMKKIRLDNKFKSKDVCDALNIAKCEYSQIEHNNRTPNFLFIDNFSLLFNLSDSDRIKLKILSKLDIFEKVFEKDKLDVYKNLIDIIERG